MKIKIVKWNMTEFVVMDSNENGYCACSEPMSFPAANHLASTVWGRVDKVVS